MLQFLRMRRGALRPAARRSVVGVSGACSTDSAVVNRSSPAMSISAIQTLSTAVEVPKDVSAWARSTFKEHGDYIAKVLEREMVNSKNLLKLTSSELEKLDILWGPRIELLEAISKLNGTYIEEPLEVIACYDEDGEPAIQLLHDEEEFDKVRAPWTWIDLIDSQGKVVGGVTHWKCAITACRDGKRLRSRFATRQLRDSEES